MKVGDKGIDVLEVQQWLQSIGYLEEVETFYSINTKNAVYTLQEDLGLTPNGQYQDEIKLIYELSLLETLTVPTAENSTGEVSTQDNARKQQKFNDYLKGAQKYPCYLVNLLTNRTEDDRGVVFFPHVPEEFTYTKGNIYDEQQVKGRSEPFLGYTGSTSLTTNVTLTLTADYVLNNDIDLILNKLEAFCYPRYGAIVKPPKAFFRCGSFTTEGVITELSITRKLPIINGKYSQAEVSISFTETSDESISAANVGISGWRD